MEALNRYRNNGEPAITVQNVSVQDGGKAIATPEAATLIRSSPAAGAGRGTSSTTTTSGAPKRWILAAFMFEPPSTVQRIDPSYSFGLLRAPRD
jgi:hypothetical protein